MVGIAVMLVGQRDLGTSLLFFGAAVLLLYLTTGRSSWLVIGGVLLVIGGTAASFGLLIMFVHDLASGLDPFAISLAAVFK